MPTIGRLLYAGVEIQITKGEVNKSLSLDDVARCLGFEAAGEVLCYLEKLGLEDQTYPVDLMRGSQEMILFGAAVRLAEAFDSPRARGFVAHLRKDMNRHDIEHYNALTQAEGVTFAVPRQDGSQRVGDQSSLPSHVSRRLDVGEVGQTWSQKVSRELSRKKYIVFEGVEMMYIPGDTETMVALDDIARALGHDFASDLSTVIGVLKLERETHPVRNLPRGEIPMITLAAAVKIAEAYESREGQALASFLRTQLPMSEFDRVRYNNLPQESIALLRLNQALSRLLENYPNAGPELVAEHLGIKHAEAVDMLKFRRILQGLVPNQPVSHGSAGTRPLPPQQMNH
ncbi:hypothetical protein [Paraburkholderia youngii]|uniref:hypothetical protein n=1 Tax=Paraburkholderia youngii TaxID=2782701 RepID=UPI003D23ED8A